MATPNRRASVYVMAALQSLGLHYANSNIEPLPVPRPFLGGIASGFHSAPNKVDHVIVLHEEGTFGPSPVGTHSIANDPSKLFALKLGESIILHSDLRKGMYFKNDGTTTLFSRNNGVTFTVDASNNTSLSGNNTLSFGVTNGLSITAPTTTINGRLTAKGLASTATPGANAGTTGTVTYSGITDIRGIINVTPNGTGVAAGQIIGVTFGTAYATAPAVVQVMGVNTASINLLPYVNPSSVTTTGFIITVSNAPVAATTYNFSYIVSP